jgi:hypothetical protein
MPSPKLKKYIWNILKIIYIKRRCVRPLHEHKKDSVSCDKCMPPVWRQKNIAAVQESVKFTFTMSAWIYKYIKIHKHHCSWGYTIRKYMVGRGVTDFNIGGKKLMNVFCGERPNVICYANADDRGMNLRSFLYLCIWMVNLLLLTPDHDLLRVETCSSFLYFYQYTFLYVGV